MSHYEDPIEVGDIVQITWSDVHDIRANIGEIVETADGSGGSTVRAEIFIGGKIRLYWLYKSEIRKVWCVEQ